MTQWEAKEAVQRLEAEVAGLEAELDDHRREKGRRVALLLDADLAAKLVDTHKRLSRLYSVGGKARPALLELHGEILAGFRRVDTDITKREPDFVAAVERLTKIDPLLAEARRTLEEAKKRPSPFTEARRIIDEGKKAHKAPSR